MNYSIVTNDVVDVDKLIDQIKIYINKFQKHENFFIHCKNVEDFERTLERQIPSFSYRVAQIYGSGRDIAFTVPSHIQGYLTIQRTAMLKTGIDGLEPKLTWLKNWGEAEHLRINKVYEESAYNDWSVNNMLARTLIMCSEIGEILTYISTIKESYSYQIQSGKLTLTDVRDLMGTKMNTINNSGNFQNSQISNGNNNSGYMTISNGQRDREELATICQKLISIIESSNAEQTEKDAVKTIVNEIETAESPSNLKNAYKTLMSAMSDHITIGTAILGSNLIPALSNLM